MTLAPHGLPTRSRPAPAFCPTARPRWRHLPVLAALLLGGFAQAQALPQTQVQTQTQALPQTLPLAPVTAEQWWRGTLTVRAQEGKACGETSGGQSLPYAKQLLLRLSPGPDERTQGLAWGEMLPTRLQRLAIPASTRSGGPPDALVIGPSDVLTLTWLPGKGPLSPGKLAATAHLRLGTRDGHLVGQWRERMAAGTPLDDQCLWSEATVDLVPVAPQEVAALQVQGAALQEVLELIEQQQDLSQDQRWQEGIVERIAAAAARIEPGSMAARSLVPVLSRLGEMLLLARTQDLARGVLRQAAALTLSLVDKAPGELTPYVTSMTPLLRAAGLLREAEALNRQAVQAMSAQGLGRSAEQARLLSGYGALLMRLRRAGDARAVYEQALDIERSHQQGRHVGVVIALINLSRACEVLGDQALSMKLADEASQLHEALGLGPLKTGPTTRGGPRAI